MYEAAEGKAEAMRDRFISVVASKFFPRTRHRAARRFRKPDRRWTADYMTRFENEETRKKAWDAFAADPEWAKEGGHRDRRSAAQEPDDFGALSGDFRLGARLISMVVRNKGRRTRSFP